MAKRGYRTITLGLTKRGSIPVRASPKTADALEIISEDMSLFHGVKLLQVLEAVYEQGRKDGAREVIEAHDSAMGRIKATIKHRGPGRPRKQK